MNIGSIDLNRRVIVVAEIGNNHEGSPDLAMNLVDAAASAGVDAVKIQVIDPERLVNRSERARIEQLTKFRLSMDTIVKMANKAHDHGMLFMASAFDVESLAGVSMEIDAVKISSGDLNFVSLLAAAAHIDKPILLSTGMSMMADIRRSVDVITDNLPAGSCIKDKLALLHCVSLYPAPIGELNLGVISSLRNEFGLTVGYSDHALGIEAAVASMVFGAQILEKHFTLDKTRQTFRDHQLSADAEDMKRLVEFARCYDGMRGNGKKCISDAEKQMALAARRSIVAARDMVKGEVLKSEDVDYLRPANGLSPMEAALLIGKKLKVDVRRHDLLSAEEVE